VGISGEGEQRAERRVALKSMADRAVALWRGRMSVRGEGGGKAVKLRMLAGGTFLLYVLLGDWSSKFLVETEGGDQGEEFDFAVAAIAVKEERSNASIPRSECMVATPLFFVDRLETCSSCCSAVPYSGKTKTTPLPWCRLGVSIGSRLGARTGTPKL
jgi:hypothetical protein